jgi:4-methyl-5(b-hydroxyethyl)-thiazole monophosphate biosynthesis
MSAVLVPLAEGFEELEAITVIDLLRRADIEVTTAALVSSPVRGSHGIAVAADTTLEAVRDREFDMIVLPGGMPGAKHLGEDARLRALLQRMAVQGRITAAICAAPSVLAQAGLLDGRRATSFPGFLDPTHTPGLKLTDGAVVSDGQVITSRGPGTAMDFALTLIERLRGRAARDAVESRLQRAPAAGMPHERSSISA